MPSPRTDWNRVHQQSYSNLDKARDKAAQEYMYNSQTARDYMQVQFTSRFGRTAHEWQLDIAEAIILGLDSVLIAGTGHGKTIPFMLILLNDKAETSTLVVISPLKILQEDQVSRFRKMGISAAAVNGDTWKSQKLREDLKDGNIRAIFIGPEMLLKHEDFPMFAREHKIFRNTKAGVIDEAHCISQWSGDFRPAYGELDKLRSFLPPDTPLLPASATLHRTALVDIREKLLIDADESFTLNLGNDRHNICTSVREMRNAEDYKALLSLINLQASSLEELDKTIIFMNAVRPTLKACRLLRKHLPSCLYEAVDFLHALRSRQDKKRVMEGFREGKIRILIATEAAGMGADIPDIKVGIHFGVPSSLAVLKQRLGRIGRDPTIEATAIILVEKSMFKEVKKSRNSSNKEVVDLEIELDGQDEVSESGDDAIEAERGNDTEVIEQENEQTNRVLMESGGLGGKTFLKSVDPDVRVLVLMHSCERDISDEYFDNPMDGRKLPLGYCCGHCDNLNHLPSTTQAPDSPPSRPVTPSPPGEPDHDDPGSVHSTPSKDRNKNGKRAMVSRRKHSTALKARRGEHRKAAQATLKHWRSKTLKKVYPHCAYTAEAILPENVLKRLAGYVHETLDDIEKMGLVWVLAEDHADEVLEVLKRVDDEDKKEKQQRRQAGSEKRREAAKKREQKKREKKSRLQKENQVPGSGGNFSNGYSYYPEFFYKSGTNDYHVDSSIQSRILCSSSLRHCVF
ncbi:P-loop containing nucleoside triphosphate hydrolase protein [Dendrothele bispora CBS 962.96]|uniref:DNA 3'-5' helicase n=1 Tax=Dendrothele bispora (strain CBS 962.96) TaxID=1314807 RepID=A0A4S8MN44_DENBC|nr:P-loop containing nucleoside triphosphate hydrolase protein [Dendrothele bispora CBS 962.96]